MMISEFCMILESRHIMFNFSIKLDFEILQRLQADPVV